MSAVNVMTNGEAPRPPVVRGNFLFGNMFEFAKDPARFFVKCYREYGPAFQVTVLGNRYVCIAGAEAATFMGTREGKEALRSKEVWTDMLREFDMTKSLSSEDGDMHNALRGVSKRGYSRESIRGRYDKMMRITADALERDWKPGTRVRVLESMQYMVVDQLGITLTGMAPREYVKEIRTTILYILNVLVTKQRPKFMMHMPEYKRSKARMMDLGRKMVEDYRRNEAANLQKPDDEKTLIDDVMEAHKKDPVLIPERDLAALMTGPYVAGLDTVANTTASIVYAVLKNPEVLKRIQDELDAYFAKGPIDEAEFMKSIPALNGAIMETMRLYPVAVAAIRVAAKDFVFAGHQLRKGEMIYLGTAVPHFQEEYFPNVETFDIDRYQKARAEHMAPGAYSPYGRGAHTCLGKSLADVLMAMTMAQIFHKLDLELDPPDYVLKTKTAPTPGPALTFKVKVKGLRHPLHA